MLEEAVALMRALWTAPGQPVSYTGRQIAVRDLVLSPAPARAGGPPVWLAGAGPRAERRVGRLADLTVALDESEPTATRRLRANVEGWYGRPLETIASLQAMYAGTPQGLPTYLEPYVDAGLEHVILRVADTAERGLATAANAIRTLSAAIPAPVQAIEFEGSTSLRLTRFGGGPERW
jgi:alkanesulfonate monooxygenase SsuD/methylene tetrahydromethanopterin reductase-like flavin-dependent oxidoreductase (luciferase family)